MEMSIASVSVSVIVVVIVTWAWRALNWMWLTPKRLERCLRKQGLAGNSYRFLVGDMKDSSNMIKDAISKPISISDDIVPRLMPFISSITQKYGKNSFIWIGPTPRINIFDPKLIKEIFLKMYDFQKPGSNPLVKLLANGLANHEGEKWARHRKIINLAFHQEKLKLMISAFRLSGSEMINKWMEFTLEEDSCEVDVWPYLQTLASDVISRTAFGSSYEQGRRIFHLQIEQGELLVKSLMSVYIPGRRFVPTKLNRRMKEIDREVRSLLRRLIIKREKAIRAGEAASDDLLGLLIESNMKEIRNNNEDKNVGITIDDVIEECKLFYVAGHETTSVLLVWTMILLSKHQEWQTQARDEVLQVFGNEKPDFERLSHLKIVTMILNEVLRLYPPAIALTRKTQKEIKLGNLTLPAGVQITLPTLLIHHDHELWGADAKEFNPKRFSEGISKATKNQLSYFPFGWGPRICIGQQFSLIEAKIAITMILQHFSFKLSPSYVHAPNQIITLQPQYGAHLILNKL